MRFNDIDVLRPEQLDFVPRDRRREVLQIFFAFVATIALVFANGYSPLLTKPEVLAPLAGALLVVGLGAYIYYKKQLNLDLVMSTEFQNLLFSQCFALGTSFALLVRRDGTIIHASDGLPKIFPNFNYVDAQLLDGIFEQGIVRQADRERLLAAIHTGQSDTLVFPVFRPYEDKKEYVVSVEPLPRPAGYCLLKGREYHGARSGLQVMPDALNATSIDKIDHLLSMTSLPLYTADSTGRFEYVNPAFENAFGYLPGEISTLKLSIHHLFFSLGGTTLTEDYTPKDYAGEAMVQLKRGIKRPAQIVQRVLLDEAGKLLGVSGNITLTTQRTHE